MATETYELGKGTLSMVGVDQTPLNIAINSATFNVIHNEHNLSRASDGAVVDVARVESHGSFTANLDTLQEDNQLSLRKLAKANIESVDAPLYLQAIFNGQVNGKSSNAKVNVFMPRLRMACVNLSDYNSLELNASPDLKTGKVAEIDFV